MIRHDGGGQGYHHRNSHGNGSSFSDGDGYGDGCGDGVGDGYGDGVGDGVGDGEGDGDFYGYFNRDTEHITVLVINDDPLTTAYQSLTMQTSEDIDD